MSYAAFPSHDNRELGYKFAPQNVLARTVSLLLMSTLPAFISISVSQKRSLTVVENVEWRLSPQANGGAIVNMANRIQMENECGASLGRHATDATAGATRFSEA